MRSAAYVRCAIGGVRPEEGSREDCATADPLLPCTVKAGQATEHMSHADVLMTASGADFSAGSKLVCCNNDCLVRFIDLPRFVCSQQFSFPWCVNVSPSVS